MSPRHIQHCNPFPSLSGVGQVLFTKGLVFPAILEDFLVAINFQISANQNHVTFGFKRPIISCVRYIDYKIAYSHRGITEKMGNSHGNRPNRQQQDQANAANASQTGGMTLKCSLLVYYIVEVCGVDTSP